MGCQTLPKVLCHTFGHLSTPIPAREIAREEFQVGNEVVAQHLVLLMQVVTGAIGLGFGLRRLWRHYRRRK